MSKKTIKFQPPDEHDDHDHQPITPDEIDFTVALPTPPKRLGRPPKPPQPPNNTPKRPRGRPKQLVSQDNQDTTPKIPLVDNNILVDSDLEIRSVSSNLSQNHQQTGQKDLMSTKELNFLAIYLTGEENMISALKSAGYTSLSESYLYRIGKKIVERYEGQVDDHRKIFRRIGAGEVAVAKGLLQLARYARSEMVRLNSWATIAKVLGLTKEVTAETQGVSIIIKSSGRAPVQVGIVAPVSPVATEDDKPAVATITT